MSMRAVPVRLYTKVSSLEPVEWSWVVDQLRAAPVYWVSGDSGGHPHPRPVWGVWHDDALWLSIGSPQLRAASTAGAAMTVHLESGTEPIIVEGRIDIADHDQSAPIAVYDAKYKWTYDAAEYGPLLRMPPATIFAWQTTGFAGRDSFQAVGKWIDDH
ncbi:MAG: pyridoxamine 5-phosphate oxidase [Ilumatobacteraceae bacterium]|nr:pyridoxamine 5-phosphate oxidase [Ilumatobacteraceae bacterium]